jgi:hypothetical protein
LPDSLLEFANGRNCVVVRVRRADNHVEGRLSVPCGITDREEDPGFSADPAGGPLTGSWRWH